MQKLAIITGGTAGLGFYTAQRAAKAGFDLIIASRNSLRGEDARKNLASRFKNVDVKFKELDLSSPDSIAAFAKSLDRPWDLLVNNAGAKIQRPYKTTDQNIEWHIGVNHIGHFSLTAQIWNNAHVAATVTTVSSIVASKGKADFDSNPQDFNERKAYANSKYLNAVFALALAKRLRGTNQKSTLAHPGFAKASPYGNKGIRFAENLAAQSALRGSETIWAATEAPNSTFLVPRFFELWGAPKDKNLDLTNAEFSHVWSESERLSGMKFNLPQNFDGE